MLRFNVVFVRLASSLLPKRCWITNPLPQKLRFDTGAPATSAAAPATTRLCAQCWTLRLGSRRGNNVGTTETKPQYKVIGKRPVRHDGVDKVTGRAVYGADVQLPGMLYGKVLRSPHAHARIKSIRT